MPDTALQGRPTVTPSGARRVMQRTQTGGDRPY